MKLKLFILSMLAVFGLSTVVAKDMTNEEIAERIKPVGQLNVGTGESAAAPAAAGPRSGEEIYNKACTFCHMAGNPMGAPGTKVAADWQPRLDAKGLDGVWKSALAGINGMPPRGNCADCTDDEIKAAIEYMVEGI